MAKVNYEDVTTKTFKNLSVGDYFIFNRKLYLKLNTVSIINNSFDFEKNKVVSFTEDAIVIFKNGNKIEISVY